MKKVYNFSAGPAVLPSSVLKKVQDEMLDYAGSGMSVMELSHRSSLFQAIIDDAECLLRELMSIPDHYSVLFLQGGASLQFSMIPMNLAQNKKVAYVNSGSWSEKAIEEALKIPDLTVDVIASSQQDQFKKVPTIPAVTADYDYLHITTNNTIEGTTYFEVPTGIEIPVIADMSSNILSSEYDVSDFGLIYAGAQKNIGPAGLTVVIIRKDLIRLVDNLPAMLDYSVQEKNNSMYNTPPTFAIYVAKLVFEWLKELGGVKSIEAINRKKAQLLYDYLDQSSLFSSPVERGSRSLTNIPFVTGDAAIDKQFVEEAEKAGFVNLKGHRSVGGMRASLYNAFPIEGVKALIEFMDTFTKKTEEAPLHVSN